MHFKCPVSHCHHDKRHSMGGKLKFVEVADKLKFLRGGEANKRL